MTVETTIQLGSEVGIVIESRFYPVRGIEPGKKIQYKRTSTGYWAFGDGHFIRPLNCWREIK